MQGLPSWFENEGPCDKPSDSRIPRDEFREKLLLYLKHLCSDIQYIVHLREMETLLEEATL